MNTNRIKELKQNRLNKIKAIQDVYKTYGGEDIPDSRVWRKYVKDTYFISLDTFREYLGVNIAREQAIINKM